MAAGLARDQGNRKAGFGLASATCGMVKSMPLPPTKSIFSPVYHDLTTNSQIVMAINEAIVPPGECNGRTICNLNAAPTLSRTDGGGCRTGAGAMRKTFYAIAAAAIVAACFVLSPSLSPQVEAGAPALSGKSDRADTRPLAGDCSQRAWPYVEAACLRDTRNTFGVAREVRFVPIDNRPHPAATSAVASR
jgi:hypothetical protein